jgi:hypothetical protein
MARAGRKRNKVGAPAPAFFHGQERTVRRCTVKSLKSGDSTGGNQLFD